MKIAGRTIGNTASPFIIAEMSGNHNHSLDRAIAIVDAAAASGAHAIKLQTYTAETMTVESDGPGFTIADPNSLWAGRSLHDLYTQAHTPWEWHRPIMERAKAKGLIAFSSPFDETAVDFLEGLDVPAYKIASFENIDLPLIRRVAATGKPVIISTGMASVAEIGEAVEAFRGAGGRDLVLLKCTSTYPASPENSNLRTIPHLRELFGCEVGLSDHTIGVGASVAAVALGATVIEKHFTLARADGGVDSAFSLEPDELLSLVVETGRAHAALGHIHYGITEAEKNSLVFRRSIYIVKDTAAGERLTPSNIRTIRPGLGLAPKYFDAVVGARLKVDAAKGTPLRWEMIIDR